MDQERLDAFIGTAVTDLAAAESAAVAYVGDVLGLYRTMAGAGAMSSAELANRTGTQERLVREWLHNQVAGGYVDYHADEGTFELPDEHAAVLADEDSPVFAGGILEVIAAMWADTDRVIGAFRADGALGWHQHDARLYRGVERVFRPIYRAQLVNEWIPALEGAEARLQSGATVADVGCGHGASTIVMATAYPNSRFVGFDYHQDSIAAARRAAEEADVGDRVRFEVASADSFPGSSYDLVCYFDCLHDMGDPIGAAAHAREVLVDDGWVMAVEPAAGDDLRENVNPVSRLFYAGSVFLCTPSSLAQDGRLGLGAQAGEKRLGAVFEKAGFRRFRRATETPFNLVLEARP
ncbi:MAG: methyltransferase domain-containing protein [Actinomycetota bacterium]|nr:methyltransferase domain-containing protein [Actinomycetota bacterium]